MSITENIKKVREKIAKAAQTVGRQPDEIKLIAVVKNVPLEDIFEAIEAGIADIGENRVQEAEKRAALIRGKYPAVTLHMIGHLQRNKVRQALDMFDIIQSVDSERLAGEIEAEAKEQAKVLIEVNTSGEESKFGVRSSEAIELVRFASTLGKIKVQGLMTLGPLEADPRSSFAALRELSVEIKKMNLPKVELKYLSMGMSGDFETAIAEGANLVRLGRAIFTREG
ncbi:YggS family pyridoxal phosphate enzyme [candidate division WOR-1 bacterium RIFCSPHIGHO2_01_FULL_53_15]|uniref:Pyridoxal phosphate homeostasis protein n=1 Tax=candidate division WOR-1 bacterium RIFCSPHIGHO2_01_FULL_53_15 TaxID=1802564 RepID=A0A1F4PZ32_UNCSA|nr:MAG: YggS family pyridoxal phosphate enzyme [candidate division WOR-1 bacterium RIFCSPHIGHO2_01_FULL_53_15]OGC10455.1 MAG: YggS family pyridoxal phosphate enzyme [candidate division WOR-1 bacterium RIFCSPHIGHO2_02_FULL_53_26]